MEQNYEQRLARLVNANRPENRYQWARDYQQAGKKVIGVISSIVPEELIWAAGMLPMRVTGVWNADIALATVYRSTSTCSYCNHVLQALLSGEWAFLDGVIAADKDQDILRMLEMAEYGGGAKSTCILHTPFSPTRTSEEYYRTQLKKEQEYLEALSGQPITQAQIRDALHLFNELRGLVREVYDLQKREHPALTGTEMLGLTTGLQVMDRAEAVEELRALLPWLRQRKAPAKCLTPRVMVSSDSLDDPAYFALVEEEGMIVMDDLDTGSRYYFYDTDESKEVYAALAERYVSRILAPRMNNWEEQIASNVDWAREYRADGVMVMPLTWCNPQRFRWPMLKRELDAAGIPAILLEREYHFANEGQLRTRIGAFLELL